MARYRLLKDLPGVKAGTEFAVKGDNGYPYIDNLAPFIRDFIHSLMRTESTESEDRWLEKIEENEVGVISSIRELDDINRDSHGWAVDTCTLPFITRVDALKYARILETQAKLRSMADWKEGVWTMIVCDEDGVSVSSEYRPDLFTMAPKFTSGESAQRAIDSIGEENLIELFTYNFKGN